MAHTNAVTETWSNDPNAMRRPGSIAATGPAASWSSGAYVYDGTGNITKIGPAWFTYDKVNRLTAGNVYTDPLGGGAGTQQGYTFDPFGNLTAITGANARNTPTTAATNRLATGTYDAAGNLTNWNGAVYRYDGFNQMVRMTSGAQDWAYVYTADDERIWSYNLPANVSNWTVRDLSGQVLREYVNDNGAWTLGTDYIHRDGQLLAAETRLGRRHFHLDHLGTPRLITNSVGYKKAYHVYYPFGEEATAFNQDSERMKFTGHERDLGSTAGAGDDLDYMHARHYGPVTGRFLSVDPYLNLKDAARYPQMWNRYTYVRANPVNMVDPTGKREDTRQYFRIKQQRELAAAARRQSRALREIRKLQETSTWKKATPEQRLAMIVRTAAKNTKGNREALTAAFTAVNRNGPLGTTVRNDLKGLTISAGAGHGQATGADKAEHLLKNAEMTLILGDSAAAVGALVAVGYALEAGQPILGGEWDPGDIEANKAGITLGLSVSEGSVDLTTFAEGDIP